MQTISEYTLIEHSYYISSDHSDVWEKSSIYDQMGSLFIVTTCCMVRNSNGVGESIRKISDKRFCCQLSNEPQNNR